MDAAFLRFKHAAGLRYEQYLATDPIRSRQWRDRTREFAVAAQHRVLLAGFSRRMPVICISGMWCGDCAVQCPMLAAIAAESPMIDLVFLDRDQHRDLSDEVRIAKGNRVPTVIWLTEEFEFVHLLGDRTLSRCRQIAQAQLGADFGAACPLPDSSSPADDSAAVLGEWVNEFERVHLLLRMSPHLRQLHGD